MLFRNLPFLSHIRKRWAGSIGFRHTVGLCIVILLVMDIASGVMFYETSKAIRKAAEDRGLAFTRTFALMGGMAVLDNLYRIQEAMSQYLQDPDILQIDVIDQDGMIVAAKNHERIGTVVIEEDWWATTQGRNELILYGEDADSKPILTILTPLHAEERVAAWVRVVFSLAPARREELQVVLRMGIITLVLITVGTFGVQLAQRRVSRVFRDIIAQLSRPLTTLGIDHSRVSTRVSSQGAKPQASHTYQGELEYLTDVATTTAGLLGSQSEALKESEERFTLAVQGSNTGIWDWDLRTNKVYFSPRWKGLLGYEEHEVRDDLSEWESRLHPQDRQRSLATVEQHLKGAMPYYELEHRLRHKDGSYRWILARGVSIRDADGKPYRMAGSYIDITDRKQAEEALQALTASLEQKVKERTAELEIARDHALVATRHKSEFLASMSHELRTPLNAIIAFSEMLLERMFGEVNAKQQEYLLDILSAGRHLLALINDILDLSRIEAGRLELEMSTFNLALTLQATFALVAERARRHGIEVDLRIDPLIGEFTADERKVKQVLLNLLWNAVKFTPKGGRIVMEAVHGDGCVEISISDTGIGIAPEEHEKIFQEFYQAKSGRARKREGTGLGLALTKKYVEVQGGRIWVNSRVGIGSTFTLKLPNRSARCVTS